MKDKFKTLKDLVPGQSNVVAIVIKKQHTAFSLLSSGYNISCYNEGILIVYLFPGLDVEKLLPLLGNYDRERIVVEELHSQKPVRDIMKGIKRFRPILLGLAMDNAPGDSRYLAGKLLDPIMQHAPCPKYLIKGPAGWDTSGTHTALVPFDDDENTSFAIDTAFKLNPELIITAAIVVPPEASAEDISSQEQTFYEQTAKWQDNPRFKHIILKGENVTETVLAETENYHFLLIGASTGSRLFHILFGEIRHKIAIESNVPTILLKEYQGKTGATLMTGWSFLDNLLPNLSKDERIEAYMVIRRGGRPNRDFFTMIALSAGIASFGLLLDNVAVIIGAMLVAPLMSAIVGMGMAIIHGDMKFLKMTFTATLKGALIAILTGFVFGLVNFAGDPNTQILQRTAPTLLDLGVALISGVAAAYAICKKNVSNSLPGVAIAVSLVPPLATVGVCLSIWHFGLAWGALKLFLSNLVAIVFASALVFASFGFRPDLNISSHNQRIRVFQKMFGASGILVIVMILLLVVETRQKVKEASFDDQIEQELIKYIKDIQLDADLEYWSLATTKSGTAEIDLELRSERQVTSDERAILRKRLKDEIGKPVFLTIEILPKINAKKSKL